MTNQRYNRVLLGIILAAVVGMCGMCGCGGLAWLGSTEPTATHPTKVATATPSPTPIVSTATPSSTYSDVLSNETQTYSQILKQIADHGANPAMWNNDNWRMETYALIRAARSCGSRIRALHPTPHFQDAHNELVRGIDYYDISWDYYEHALDTNNPALLLDAAVQAKLGNQCFENAANMLP